MEFADLIENETNSGIVVAAEQKLPGAATILSILENSGAADIQII